MKKYEVAIGIIDKERTDDLVIALVRQGYNVYYNEMEEVVCFTTGEGEVTDISPKDVKTNPMDIMDFSMPLRRDYADSSWSGACYPSGGDAL